MELTYFGVRTPDSCNHHFQRIKVAKNQPSRKFLKLFLLCFWVALPCHTDSLPFGAIMVSLSLLCLSVLFSMY